MGRYENQTFESFPSNYSDKPSGKWIAGQSQLAARFYWQDWDSWSNPQEGNWDVNTRYWYLHVGEPWNDDIEALWLWPHSKIEIHQHRDYTGRSYTYLTDPNQLYWDSWAIPHDNSPEMSRNRTLAPNTQFHLSGDDMKNRTTSFRVWTWHTYDNYGSSLSSNPAYELKDNTNAENVNADLRDIKYRIDEVTYTLVGADGRNFTAESLSGVDRTDLQGNELEMEKEYVAAIDNFDHSYYTYSTFGVNEHGDKILESVAIRRRNEGVVGSYPGELRRGKGREEEEEKEKEKKR